MAIQGVTPSFRRLTTCCLLAVFVASCSSETGQSRSAIRPGSSDSGQCVDYSGDPAGCQPSTFDTPIGQMPSVRVGAQGGLDPFSSEADARAGFAALETELHLFRNFERIHWVLTVPSERDPGTGAWRGGDLEGAGDARGLGIAGQCMYVGHRNGPGSTHPINIFRIQPDPETMPPVQVGEIPAMVIGNEGFDDRELRSLVYTTSAAEERQNSSA